MSKLLALIARLVRLHTVSNRRRLWVLLLVALLPVNLATANSQLSMAGMPMQACGSHDSNAMPPTDGEIAHQGHLSVAATLLDHPPAPAPGLHDCCDQSSCGDCSIGAGVVMQRLPMQSLILHGFADSSPLTRSVEALSILLYRPPISA